MSFLDLLVFTLYWLAHSVEHDTPHLCCSLWYNVGRHSYKRLKVKLYFFSPST